MRSPIIGFIGTGIMGLPMARNLLRAGFAVRAFNRTRAKAERLIADGATVVDSAAAAADGADVVVSIVTDSPDVEAVYLGANGVASAARLPALAIDMSTISPAVERRIAEALAAKGCQYLDAPVSGGDKGAIAGTLSIMVGGPAEAFTRAEPIFRAMGKTIVHCGASGAGQVTKLCNQILVSLSLLGVAEAVTIARKADLDVDKMLQAVSSGAAKSWQLENLGPKMRDGDFAPGFMIDLLQKDLRLVLELARQITTSLPGTAIVNQLFTANQAAGEGREGTQALVKTIERLSAVL
jgi:3-hydroxyisobutyrate dehydrogenase